MDIFKKIARSIGVATVVGIYGSAIYIGFIKPKLEIKRIEKNITSFYVAEGEAESPEHYPKELVEKVKRISEKSPKDIIDSLSTPLEASIYCTEILKKGLEEAIEKGLKGIPSINEGGKKIYSIEDYISLRDSIAESVPLRFSEISKAKKGVCRQAVVAAAAILKKKNAPYTIGLSKNKKEKGHGVLIYKNQDNKFGSIGINNSDIHPPIYNSINELVKAINIQTSAETGNIIKYRLLGISSVEKAYPDFDK
jgi:hypothetical protein